MPASDAHSAALADGLPAPRRWLAVAVLLLTFVLVVLDTAIANVALPSIAASFYARPGDTVWVVSSYQLAVLISLLPCGALGEMFGPRRVAQDEGFVGAKGEVAFQGGDVDLGRRAQHPVHTDGQQADLLGDRLGVRRRDHGAPGRHQDRVAQHLAQP